jgi:hypothetical protein
MLNKKFKMQANGEQQQQPSVITLNKTNSIQILIQYIEIAQKAGAYELKEAEILKRSVDVLINNVNDPEINENLAINLLIQGILKGQKHGGAFNLNDAALLQKVIQYIVSLSSENNESSEASASEPESVKQEETNDDDDDLSSLSEPVPLRPKEI